MRTRKLKAVSVTLFDQAANIENCDEREKNDESRITINLDSPSALHNFNVVCEPKDEVVSSTDNFGFDCVYDAKENALSTDAKAEELSPDISPFRVDEFFISIVGYLLFLFVLFSMVLLYRSNAFQHNGQMCTSCAINSVATAFYPSLRANPFQQSQFTLPNVSTPPHRDIVRTLWMNVFFIPKESIRHTSKKPLQQDNSNFNNDTYFNKFSNNIVEKVPIFINVTAIMEGPTALPVTSQPLPNSLPLPLTLPLPLPASLPMPIQKTQTQDLSPSGKMIRGNERTQHSRKGKQRQLSKSDIARGNGPIKGVKKFVTGIKSALNSVTNGLKSLFQKKLAYSTFLITMAVYFVFLL